MEDSLAAHSAGSELKRAATAPDAPHPNDKLDYDNCERVHAPFIGRLGGNQRFVLDRNDPRNAYILQEAPDAAPQMTLKEQLELRPFRDLGLWKRAITEGIGTLMLVYITLWPNLSPNVIPTPPSTQLGNFDNAAFLGPLIGAIINFLTLTLFTISFGAVTGAHLNPTITIATFCSRMCSLPRMVLYVAFQTAGGALAGLLVRASFGTRDFKAGGCFLFPDVVPAGDAFAVEFLTTLTLLFLAFGVGLDPRQKQVIPASLSPFLVGLTSGTLTIASAFTRYGYGGASMNPARCFGSFVGSSFPSWHWIHWVADIIACMVHGFVYLSIPPGQLSSHEDKKQIA